ncbi:hypothetical protein ACNI3K_08410 [Demequina sp. SO4-13]|uniref:hypothetical protein n=1 Tax=Demequina sp. SO4-13 TaxID=3401027 RepID=UPI003AF7F81D
MHPIVFVSPFSNTENPYIARQQEVLRGLGCEVRPLSLGALLKGRCWGLTNSRNVVLVHWLENRLFKKGKAQRRVSVLGAAQFAVYVVTLALARARVVYVVHDHDVHDVKDSLRWLSTRAIRLLRRVADSRVVHDPSFAARYGATYLPHPLYAEPTGSPPLSSHSVPSIAAMGAIRPYKCLDAVLEGWPPDVPLLIAGTGDPAYIARLRAIVARRALEGAVTIDDRFLSDDEFFATLGARDVLLLPHRAGANLVSGAFFAGVGHVRLVLARETPFIAWAQRRMTGIVSFADDADIGPRVNELAREWSTMRTVDLTPQAIAEFGDAACREAYGRFLGVTIEGPDPATAHAARSEEV